MSGGTRFSMGVPPGMERAFVRCGRLLAAMMVANYAGDRDEFNKLGDELIGDSDACASMVTLTLASLKTLGLAPANLRELADQIAAEIEEAESDMEGEEGHGGSEEKS